MPNIPLGVGDWGSATQNVQRLKLHNMYVVPNPTTVDGLSRVSRPTITSLGTVGASTTSKIWQQNNVFNGDLFTTSGTTLYRVTPALATTSVGTIAGTDIPEFAGLAGSLFVVRNGVLYNYDGTTLSTITIPDGLAVQSVATINGYVIFSIVNSQKFFWLTPGSIVVDPLNFASAERNPDVIVDVQIVGDEIWFLGAAGPEVWAPTGDATAPFQRVSGRIYKEGCFSRDTVSSTSVHGLPALFWVTDAKAVVKAQGAPQKVSNEAVEEILKTSDAISQWSFRYNRHDFYVLSSPLFTLVYDITSDLWARWDTYNLPYWAVQSGAQINSTVYCGSINSNKIYRLDEGVDDDGLPIIREVAGFLGNSSQPIPCKEVVAYVNSGWSPSYTIEPFLELRWSDDMGATWSDYVSASLGQKGDYQRSVCYRSLGLIFDPGRIFEFRISDFVRFRIDYVMMNERLK